ncbi:MAG: hypothetical protein AB1758_14845 [Candidatus Eremiobacterota bacterium]
MIQTLTYPSTPTRACGCGQRRPAEERSPDRVELGSDGPRLMAGVPTGYLSPQIPPPSLYATTVGLELAPGVGISLDGKALLVAHRPEASKLEIVGHLTDGTYPQRDFTVVSDGSATVVDGYFDHQDYRLEQQGDRTVADGHEDVQDFSIQDDGRTLRVDSRFAARAWTATREGQSADVRSDWAEGETFRVTREGNTTRVESSYPESSFTLTREDDGRIVVDGHYAFQDFTLTPGEGGFVLQGHFPQQRFEVRQSAL